MLTNGRGACFVNPDPLASEPYLVIADLDAGSQWARIDLAAPVALHDIEQLYREQIVEAEAVTWDARTQSVRASRQRRLGALILSEQALSKPDPSLIAGALLDGVRQSRLGHAGLDAGTPTLADTSAISQTDGRTELHMARSLG